MHERTWSELHKWTHRGGILEGATEEGWRTRRCLLEKMHRDSDTVGGLIEPAGLKDPPGSRTTLQRGEVERTVSVGKAVPDG